jgi:Transposase IS116/IS110/IS902 family
MHTADASALTPPRHPRNPRNLPVFKSKFDPAVSRSPKSAKHQYRQKSTPKNRPERVLFAGAVKRVSGFSLKSYPLGPSSRPGVAVVSPYLQVVRPRLAPGAAPGPAASPAAEWQRPGNAQPCPGTASGWTGGQKVRRLAVCGRGAGRSRDHRASGRASRYRVRPRPQAARQDRLRSARGTCGCCWPGAGCRSAGSRPATSWSAGRCWSCTTTCAASAPPGRSGSTRSCSIRAPRSWAGGALRTEKGVAGLRAAAAVCLSPAGQLQVAIALEVIDALEARLHVVRHQLLDAARHLAGAKALAARLYGVGPVTALAMTCWLGGAGRFSSSRQAVRFTGLDITVSSSAARGRPGSCPGRGRRCCAGPSMRPAKRTPAPDHRYYAAGQGPQEQQARLPVRGPPIDLPRARADSWPSKVRSRMYSRSISPEASSSSRAATPLANVRRPRRDRRSRGGRG